MNAFGQVLLDLLLLLAVLGGTSSSSYVTVCYYNARGINYHIRAHMPVDQIEASLCTHVVWAHGYIDVANKTIRACQVGDHSCFKRFQQFAIMKVKKPWLKTMMSIDGAAAVFNGQKDSSAGIEPFVAISQTHGNLDAFARNVTRYLRNRKIHGLVIDWTFPMKIYHTDELFVNLVKRFRGEFEAVFVNGTNEGMILAVALPSKIRLLVQSFDIQDFHAYVHYLFVKTYDYNTWFPRSASFSSPLNASDPRYPTYNVRHSIGVILQHFGVPSRKIVLGLSWKATRYILDDEKQYKPGSTATVVTDNASMFSGPEGVPFFEVCIMSERPGAVPYWDEVQKMTYFVYKTTWVGFEEQMSIDEKVKFMKSRQLAGVMVVDMEMDDNTGQFCGDLKYPLLTLLDRAINGRRPSAGMDSGALRVILGFIPPPLLLLVLIVLVCCYII